MSKFMDFVNTLDNFGWAYSGWYETKIGGKKRTLYRLEKYPVNHPTRPYAELIEALKKKFENVWTGTARPLYAHEMRTHVIGVW